MSNKVFGGMLLVAGSCIGAGMLGLPIVMGILGFYPSVILLIAAWLFMTFTSLLLVEVSGWFSKQVNLISMTERAMGRIGKVLSWILYIFLFFSLLVAYTAASGSIADSIFHSEFSRILTCILFAFSLGFIVFLGTGPVDFSNRILMFGKIGFYVAMLILGLSKVQLPFLIHTNFEFFFLPLSILVISFGYHNIVPSLVGYMKGDLKEVKKAIIGGSFLALVVYMFWILMIIGIVPYDGDTGLLVAYQQGREVSSSLKSILGTTYITLFAQGFSGCALFTAFLAQSLCLSHFLADGFKVEISRKNSLWLVPLSIIPPLLFALIYPSIFFKALNFAGGVCAIVLFGFFPVIMAWEGRYVKNQKSSYVVRGGKVSLVVAILFGLIVFINELVNLFKHL